MTYSGWQELVPMDLSVTVNIHTIIEGFELFSIFEVASKEFKCMIESQISKLVFIDFVEDKSKSFLVSIQIASICYDKLDTLSEKQRFAMGSKPLKSSLRKTCVCKFLLVHFKPRMLQALSRSRSSTFRYKHHLNQVLSLIWYVIPILYKMIYLKMIDLLPSNLIFPFNIFLLMDSWSSEKKGG